MFCLINTLRPRQDGRHFTDDTFKWIFLNENVWISIKNSLKFVPKGPIKNIPTLVQITAWRRPGDNPLSEPMLVFVPTHICVTRPQWVKVLFPSSNLHLSILALACMQLYTFCCATQKSRKKTQGKFEGFDSRDRPSNLTHFGFKSSIFRPCDLEIWWMTRRIIRHVFYTTSSVVYHFISISKFKPELQSGNAQSGSN